MNLAASHRIVNHQRPYLRYGLRNHLISTAMQMLSHVFISILLYRAYGRIPTSCCLIVKLELNNRQLSSSHPEIVLVPFMTRSNAAGGVQHDMMFYEIMF